MMIQSKLTEILSFGCVPTLRRLAPFRNVVSRARARRKDGYTFVCR